jgi:hypothetical protein
MNADKKVRLGGFAAVGFLAGVHWRQSILCSLRATAVPEELQLDIRSRKD